MEEKIKKELEKYIEIKNILEKRKIEVNGRLDIAKGKDYVRYYHVYKDTLSNKFIKKYIEKDKISIAYKLAQHSYDKIVLNICNKRIKHLKYLSNYSENEIDDIYNNLSPQRKELIMPVKETWNQKLEKWINDSFQPSSYPFPQAEIYTKKNERVRSKSEKILADMFYDLGIPYKYECPLKLKNGSFVYPDFTFLSPITGEEIYWEHYGMMDIPNYCTAAIKKIASYEVNGIFTGKNLIVSFESSKSGLDFEWIKLLINRHLKTEKSQ